MTLVAALYDIHGNVPALRAVLADVERLDPDVIVIGGDTVWGPWPQETMDILRGLDGDVRWIMGNADRDVFDRVDGQWKATNDWCADRSSDEHLEFLRTRPASISVDDVHYCHGSPRSDTDVMTIATPEDRVQEWCSDVSERTVVCGHTHAQFDRRVGDLRIVNAGSVGEPFGDRAAYWAVFGSDVELRNTPYDVDDTAARILSTGYPYAATLAANITEANANPAQEAALWFESKQSS